MSWNIFKTLFLLLFLKSALCTTACFNVFHFNSVSAVTITSKPVDKLLDINLYVEVTRGNKAGEFNISWKVFNIPCLNSV